MAVASSSPQTYIEAVTDYWGIRPYFQILVSGEQVEHPKPAPDIFLKTASILGLSSDECLVIEDSENGCRAAQAANMTCMAYYNPDSGKQNLQTASVVVEGFEEIDAIFVNKIYCHHHHLVYSLTKLHPPPPPPSEPETRYTISFGESQILLSC